MYIFYPFGTTQLFNKPLVHDKNKKLEE